MTQDDAKTKWCPQTPRTHENTTVCIGSGCALWVWTKTRDHSRGPDCTMPKAEWQGQCGLIRTEGAY